MIFKIIPNFFCHIGEQHYKEAKVNFEIYGITHCTTNNCNKHIA